MSGVQVMMFHEYIGIDYSGAQTAESSLKGLRVYRATHAIAPEEVLPPPGSKKYWTRRGLAAWLIAELTDAKSGLIGIDHGFSFPIQYFEAHQLDRRWDAFLEDFHWHWPTDVEGTYVDHVRGGSCGNAGARTGDPRWRRLTEIRAGGAKSVFHFDVQGSVAKSTHAGLPWLRRIRQACGAKVHVWPFDGWSIPAGKSVVAEVYPSLWNRAFPKGTRTADQQDAYAVAAWLRQADLDGKLSAYFHPALTGPEKQLAAVEGWILGVR